MRITRLIVAGSVLALVTAPALAKNPESRKTDDKSTSPAACHAYQKADDGSWIERPCQEEGTGATQHKPAAKGADDEPR
jgi:hypothetical protein